MKKAKSKRQKGCQPVSLYVSDLHNILNAEDCNRKNEIFSAFPAFCEENGIAFKQVFIGGDFADLWVPGRGATYYENILKRPEFIQFTRKLFSYIIRYGEYPPDIVFCLGNHETVVADQEDLNEYPHLPQDGIENPIRFSEIGVEWYREFFTKVFEDKPEAKINVYHGIGEAERVRLSSSTEQIVVFHHGHLSEGIQSKVLKSKLNDLDKRMRGGENISLKEKLRIINEDPRLHEAFQKRWHFVKTNLWDWLWDNHDAMKLKNAAETILERINYVTSEIIKEALHRANNTGAILDSGGFGRLFSPHFLSRHNRTFSDQWNNPVNQAMFQFRIMDTLLRGEDGIEEPVIVSGDRHQRGIVSVKDLNEKELYANSALNDCRPYRGTAVLLGGFDQMIESPACAIHMPPYDKNGGFRSIVYSKADGKWHWLNREYRTIETAK